MLLWPDPLGVGMDYRVGSDIEVEILLSLDTSCDLTDFILALVEEQRDFLDLKTTGPFQAITRHWGTRGFEFKVLTFSWLHCPFVCPVGSGPDSGWPWIHLQE